jgi:hypothetical protein
MLLQRRRNVQTGRGLGTILSSIFRTIAPYAKTLLNVGKRIFSSRPAQAIVKSAQQSALQSGLNVVDDVIKGKNVKRSLKEHAQSLAQDVGSSAVSEVKKLASMQPPKVVNKKSAANNKKKRKNPVLGSKKTRPAKRSKGDIFDSV